MKVDIQRYKRGENKGSIRKCVVQIDKHDTWNCDWTLATIAAQLLTKLKETKQGAPYVDDEDVPEHFRSTACAPKENEWDTDANHFKRWDYVLDTIIFAMTEIANNNENEPEMYRKVGEIEWGEPDERGCVQLISTGLEIIPEMEQPNKDYHECIKNGCMLLGKYFTALWT